MLKFLFDNIPSYCIVGAWLPEPTNVAFAGKASAARGGCSAKGGIGERAAAQAAHRPIRDRSGNEHVRRHAFSFREGKRDAKGEL